MERQENLWVLTDADIKELQQGEPKYMKDLYNCMIRATEDLILQKEIQDPDQGALTLLLTLEKLRIKRERLLK